MEGLVSKLVNPTPVTKINVTKGQSFYYGQEMCFKPVRSFWVCPFKVSTGTRTPALQLRRKDWRQTEG